VADKTAEEIWNEELLTRAAAQTAGATDEPEDDDAVEGGSDQADAAANAGAPGQASTLPPELQELATQFGDLKGLLETLRRDVASTAGRVGSLQSEMEQARKAAQAVQRAPNEQAIKAAFKTPAKWEELKKDFPDWADAMEQFVDAKTAAERAANVGEERFVALQQQVQKTLDDMRAQSARVQEEVRLTARHPDWVDVVKSEAFTKFREANPKANEVFLKSQSAAESIEVLNQFKAAQRDATRDVSAERQQKLRAAAAPVRRASPPATRLSDDQLTPEQIWAQEAAALSRRRQAANS
jgi:hypothetical protein